MIYDEKLPNLMNDIVKTNDMDGLYKIYQRIVNSDRYGKHNAHLKNVEKFIETEYLIALMNYDICNKFKEDYNKKSLGNMILFKTLLLRLLTHPDNDYRDNYMRNENGTGNNPRFKN